MGFIMRAYSKARSYRDYENNRCFNNRNKSGGFRNNIYSLSLIKFSMYAITGALE